MKVTRFVSAAAAAAMIAALVATAPAGAAPQSHSAKSPGVLTRGRHVALHKVGRVNVAALARQQAAHPIRLSKKTQRKFAQDMARVNRRVGSQAKIRTAATLQPPSPKFWSISGKASTGFSGFTGLNANQSRAANGFDVEPPDQGLCQGNGYVIDFVNLVEQVYSTSGKAMQSPVAMNTFFGLDVNQFTSDPKCVYDPQTHLFYATALASDFSTYSANLLAVSQTSNPTGWWNVWEIDTTDGDGSLYAHPACPCFGDQPLLGFDANGIYISTNEFAWGAGNGGIFFDGTQIYAISKTGLLHGYAAWATQYSPWCDTSADPVDPWCYFNDPTAGTSFGTLEGNNQIYSQQPITSANGSAWKSYSGTMFFLGTADYNAGPTDLGGGLVLLALTGDNGLNGSPASPTGWLTGAFVKTNVYGMPPLANQKSGPVPVADYINTVAEPFTSSQECGTAASLPPCVEGQIETNDDRMNQTFLTNAGGTWQIWGAFNTVVMNKNLPNRSAIKWVEVRPRMITDEATCTSTLDGGATGFDAPCVSGSLTHQNLIATKSSEYYPSIVVAPNGHAFATFSLSGASYYPSAAYATNIPASGQGTIYIYGAGKDPQDGFTEYLYPPGRWGDYSAAEVTTSGKVWFAAEWIPGQVDVLGGGLANWGTKVGSLSP